MNISAINCTPIKPQASFKGLQDADYDKVLLLTSKVNDEFVPSDDVKSPAAALLSIGLAGLLAFASGKKIGSLISRCAKKAPDMLDKAVQNSGKVVDAAKTKLTSNTSGKLGKVRELSADLIGKVQGAVSKGYNKIANFGLKEGADIATQKANAFNNVIGCASLATVLPTIFAKDSNDDGVSDILQRGQNAYTGTKSKIDGMYHKATVLSELAEIVA